MTAAASRVVRVVRCADYATGLPPALARLLDACPLLAPAAVSGRRVLVKPNLLTDRTPEEAVTTPRRRSASLRERSLFMAPRSLKEPVVCMHSALA